MPPLEQTADVPEPNNDLYGLFACARRFPSQYTINNAKAPAVGIHLAKLRCPVAGSRRRGDKEPGCNKPRHVKVVAKWLSCKDQDVIACLNRRLVDRAGIASLKEAGKEGRAPEARDRI